MNVLARKELEEGMTEIAVAALDGFELDLGADLAFGAGEKSFVFEVVEGAKGGVEGFVAFLLCH